MHCVHCCRPDRVWATFFDKDNPEILIFTIQNIDTRYQQLQSVNLVFFFFFVIMCQPPFRGSPTHLGAVHHE